MKPFKNFQLIAGIINEGLMLALLGTDPKSEEGQALFNDFPKALCDTEIPAPRNFIKRIEPLGFFWLDMALKQQGAELLCLTHEPPDKIFKGAKVEEILGGVAALQTGAFPYNGEPYLVVSKKEAQSCPRIRVERIDLICMPGRLVA